ncbi:MAG: hypothetical protein K6G84_02275 [Lachnospiraceae bacterium]|nr:hypothetical protein [Lachnospiraceae bacterium]
MYIPAVPDTKHKDFDFKLCSDQLTRRSVLKEWHPNYQKWLDDAGVHATVASGITSGRGISVKALKEITRETGLSLTQLKSLEVENQKLYRKLVEKEQELALAHSRIIELETKQRTLELSHAQEQTWGDSSWEINNDNWNSSNKNINTTYEEDLIW